MKARFAVSASVVLAAIASFAPIMNSVVSAKPSGIFQKLSGTWRGSGHIKLAGGNSQRINCRAYYNIKDSGSGIGFAIRCASPDNKIELRARIKDINGRLSGTWEERTFNATGQISGTASGSLVNLTIDGAVSGSVRISYSGRHQKVSISTATDGLRGIAINLRR